VADGFKIFSDWWNLCTSKSQEVD